MELELAIKSLSGPIALGNVLIALYYQADLRILLIIHNSSS